MKITTLLSHMSRCFFIIIILLLSTALAQEVDDEKEFDYFEGSVRGPVRWGELHEEWQACSNGNMQSPIDLLSEKLQIMQTLGRLKTSYNPANATLRNRGHDIMLKWIHGGGSLYLNGEKFKLLQFHWHSPSEHTIDERRFDLEAHMVHESSDGRVAVIGLLYKIGKPDKFLLKESIHSIANSHATEIDAGVVDAKDIKIRRKKYYRYMGSLTVPPCTEGVQWIVLKKIRSVSKEQVMLLREAVHDDAEANARPLQPINKRLVQLYTPTPNN